MFTQILCRIHCLNLLFLTEVFRANRLSPRKKPHYYFRHLSLFILLWQLRFCSYNFRRKKSLSNSNEIALLPVQRRWLTFWLTWCDALSSFKWKKLNSMGLTKMSHSCVWKWSPNTNRSSLFSDNGGLCWGLAVSIEERGCLKSTTHGEIRWVPLEKICYFP